MTRADDIDPGKLAAIAQLAAMLSHVAPLAAVLISDDFTDEERHRFRHLFGVEEFFELTNDLNGLCSRAAREQLVEQRRRAS